MTHEVELPNGQIAEFPDDMTDEQIHQALMSGAGGAPQNQERGLLDIAVNNPLTQGVLGAGDALRNQMANVMNLAPGANVPTFNMGEGLPYTIGNIAGNTAGYIGGGEALGATKLAKVLGSSPMADVFRRTLGGATYGAVENPKDRTSGALMGTAASLGGEAIPHTLKLLVKGAEYLKPQKFANNLAQAIRSNTLEWKDVVGKYMNPAIEKYGKINIYRANPSNEFRKIYDDVKDYFSPNVKRLVKTFVKEKYPMNVAHELKTLLGDEASAIQHQDIHKAQAMTQARQSLKTDMLSSLEKRSPEMAADYNKGSDIFKEKIGGMRANDYIDKISKGEIKRVKPEKLNEELLKLKESGKIDQNHILSKMSDLLNEKVQKGSAASNAASLGLGGVMGGGLGSLIGGPLGATSGVPIGAYIAKALSGPALELATNPYITKAAKKLSPYYNRLKQGIISNVLSGS